MFDASQLGTQLRKVRKRVGVSQMAAAQALGLPRTAVTNMENGRREVSTFDLYRLAEFYGCTERSLLPSDEPTNAEQLYGTLLLALPELRKLPSLGNAVRRLLGIYRDGLALRRVLNQTEPLPVPDRAKVMESVDDAILQGENAALQERRRLDLGNAPIRSIAKVISDQGIWMSAVHLPKGVSGLFVNHSDIGMAIVVNQEYRQFQRRFSSAHEYAHALFDRRETATVTRSENSVKLMEVRANSFAAAFLMPPSGVAEQLAQYHKGIGVKSSRIVHGVAGDRTTEKEVRSSPSSPAIAYQDVARLAQHFGVSYAAVVWRLQELNYIRSTELEALMRHQKFGTKLINLIAPHAPAGEDVEQSVSCEPELPRQLLTLAIEAIHREEISMGRYREICRKFSVDEEAMLNLARTSVKG